MAYDVSRKCVVLFSGSTFRGGRPRGYPREWNGEVSEAGRRFRSQPQSTLYGLRCARERIVLFGGLGNVRLGDTWEWDGQSLDSGCRQGTKPSQVRRYGLRLPATTHTPLRRVRRLRNLWGHLGLGCVEWTQLDSTGPARMDHAMAYDSGGPFFGGLDESFEQLLGDTWEWDGYTWIQVAISAPPRAEVMP